MDNDSSHVARGIMPHLGIRSDDHAETVLGVLVYERADFVNNLIKG
jgi:hypothetical protein